MRTALIVGVFLVVLAMLPGGLARAQEGVIVHHADNRDPSPGPVGAKPYEMAGRVEAHPALADFQDVSGWEIVGTNAEGWLSRSQDERLYGEYSGKLTYVGRGANPSVLVRPARPIAIADPWDAVTLWVWGNNWGWVPDPSTPVVQLAVVLRDAAGAEFELPLGSVDSQYWFLMHARLQEARPRPMQFVGLRLTGGTNTEPRSIYLGPLSFHQDSSKPLTFAPWPEKLPFPTRPETILPVNKRRDFGNWVEPGYDLLSDEAFAYLGSDGKQFYSYQPRDGTLGDVRAITDDPNGPVFRPFAGGGVELATPNGMLAPDDPSIERTLLSTDAHFCSENDIRYTAKWHLRAGEVSTDLTYRMRIVQKSLIIEMEASEPVVARVSLGRAVSLGRTESIRDPKFIWVPYLTYGGNDPHVLSVGDYFVFSQFDWYYSDASRLYGGGQVGPGWAVFNGGAEYTPKTDGTRNRLHERLFLTVSRDFQEVLPTIPNPKSPFQADQGQRVWRVKMGQPYPEELAEARQLRSYGLDKVTVRYHEDFWRDAGESFTFRLHAAPGRGGDAALEQFVSDIKSLGWRIGLYTNYTDFAPVNARWDEDWVTRLPDGEWQRAWPRCYAPKPMRAVEAEAELAPQIHAKFGENHSYCDVHTCVSPFDRVDYDARVPGAATFRRTFECFGRLLYNEKTAHGGPVYSEGTNHWWYAGLVDGNYAQLNHPEPSTAPLLVDFDLLKLHPLEMDAGMGAPGMFFRDQPWNLDQFLATTIAYGHIGFLEWSDLAGVLKQYYMMQQLQSRYAMVPVKTIEYWDGTKLVDSSQAMRTGAYRNNRVHVVYQNDLQVYVNGNREPWAVQRMGRTFVLPQWGYLAWTPAGDLLTYSGEMPLVGPAETRGGRARVDLSFGPNYVYASTGGGFAYFGAFGVAGSAVLKRENGTWWIIPTPTCYHFAFDPAFMGATGDVNIVAEDGSPADVRWSRGMVHLLPKEGVRRYRVTPASRPRPPMVEADDTLLVAGAPARLTLPAAAHAKAGEAYWATMRELRPPASVQRRGDGYTLSIRSYTDVTAGEWAWLAIPAASGTLWLDVLPEVQAVPTIAIAPAVALRRGEKLTVTASLQNNLKRPVTLPLTMHCHGPYPPASPDQKSPAEGGPIPELRSDAVIEPVTAQVSVPAAGSASVPVHVAFPWEEGTYLLAARTEFPGGAGYEGGVVEGGYVLSTRIITPLVLDLLDPTTPVTRGYRLRGGEETVGLSTSYDGLFNITRESSGGEQRGVIFAHPPWGEGRAGYAFGSYSIALPAEARPALTFAMGIRDGAQSTDGAVYRVIAIGPEGTARALFAQQYNEHRWQPVTVDLTRYAGQRITLKLITDCGPADDTNADHALWAEPRIVDQEGRLEVRAQ